MKSRAGRSLFRFELKTMVVIVTALAISLGLVSQELNREHRKKRNAADIIRLGGNVRYNRRPQNEQTGIINGYLRVFLGDKYFPELESVQLNTQVEEDLDLVLSFPEMTRLSIAGASVTDNALARLSSLTQLQYLGVNDAVLNDTGLKSITELRNLTSLRFGSCSLAGQSLSSLADFPNLKSLDFTNCSISDEAMKSLKQFATSTLNCTLTFNDCTLTASNLKTLHGARSTLQLRLSVTNITEAEILDLRTANPGWSVQFSGHSMDKAKSKDYKGFLPSIQELPQIDELEFSGMLTSDATLIALKEASNLTSLKLTNCSVTDDGLQHLLPLKKLQLLSIHGIPITDEGVPALQGMTNLGNLSLADTAIAGNTLGKLPSSLTRLVVSQLKVSKQAAAQIASLASLEELLLMKCQLSDAAIDGLAEMTELCRLHIWETPISDPDLLRLNMALPNCLIFTE